MCKAPVYLESLTIWHNLRGKVCKEQVVRAQKKKRDQLHLGNNLERAEQQPGGKEFFDLSDL